MSHILLKTIELLRPIKRYPLTIFFLTLLLSLPNIYAPDSIPFLVRGMMQDFGWVYIFFFICCMVEHVSSRGAKVLCVAVHVLIDFVSLLTIEILYISGTKMCKELLLVIYETSVEESINFVLQFKWQVLLSVVGVIALIAVQIYLCRVNQKAGKWLERFHPALKWCMMAIVVSSLLVTPFEGRGSLGNFKHQFKNFIFYTQTVEWVVQSNQDLDNVQRSDSTNVVLIIGESFNRHHSSLYGYPQETNPRLSSLRDNLYVFDDVISPYNYTLAVFNYILSMASVDQDMQWYDAPLFPCLLKKAGYKVLFWTNQTGACSYAFDERIHFLDVKNNVQFEMDDEFVDDFRRYGAPLEEDRNTFTVIHLCGQHFFYGKRFPASETFFKPSDYNRELRADQLQIVADYDNATRFNDSIVYEIIQLYKNRESVVIYLSDHAEEVYDFRDFSGRSYYDGEDMAGWMRNEYDVPLMIYLSDRYKESHPEMVRKVENSLHRPFMTDDLPHLVLDIAGVNSKWKDPKRCLIDDSFDVKRKRLVQEWGDVKYDYDTWVNKR